jgi:hypothetical protein
MFSFSGFFAATAYPKSSSSSLIDARADISLKINLGGGSGTFCC